MMTCARRYSVVPLLALAAASCGMPPSSGTNFEMQAALERAWNSPTLGLVLGNVRFIERSPGVLRADVSKGEDFLTELPLYRAAEANQLIKMSGEPNLMAITPTDSGMRRGSVVNVQNTQELLVRINSARIRTITASDSLVANGDRYRIVQGTYTLNIDDDFKAAYVQARGDTLPPERRFKALLTFDRAQNGWALIRTDLGPTTGDFATPRVDQALAQLRQCGKPAC
jgi:hypothetical protein